MRSSSRWRAIGALVLAGAVATHGSPAAARAPTKERTVLAWPVAVDAGLEPAARAELDAAVRTGLERAEVTSAAIDATRIAEANACADEACTLLGSRRRGHGGLEAGGIPRHAQRAPAPAPFARVEVGKKRLITKSGSHLGGVVENPLGKINAGQRRV